MVNDREQTPIDAEIAKLMSETARLNEGIRWYETAILITIIVAVIGITKLFS